PVMLRKLGFVSFIKVLLPVLPFTVRLLQSVGKPAPNLPTVPSPLDVKVMLSAVNVDLPVMVPVPALAREMLPPLSPPTSMEPVTLIPALVPVVWERVTVPELTVIEPVTLSCSADKIWREPRLPAVAPATVRALADDAD